jgi:hypothetical protein
MKIHWSIADQELLLTLEYMKQQKKLPKIPVPFVNPKYFMFGHEDKQTLTKRIAWIGGQLKIRIFG